MLALAVADRPDIAGRVLHFAAEPALSRVLRERADEYVTTDIEGEVDVSADIVDLPFEDGRWDVIVCSHVLEHVPDDDRAIRQLRRVLAPGGTAVVMVPRVSGRPTDEDPTITSPGERARRFGQADHVRLYGDDLEDRLRRGGFGRVEPVLPEDFPDWAETARLTPLVGTGDVTLFCA